MVPNLPSGPEVRRKWKDTDGLANRNLAEPSDLAVSAKKIPPIHTYVHYVHTCIYVYT